MRRPPPLLHTDTHVSADMLYFGRVEVHDPFIAFATTGGKKVTVQGALEFGRVKKTSAFDLVLSREKWLARAKERHGPKAGIAEAIACLAREYGIRRFRVADDFSATLWVKLHKLGLKLELANGLLFPEREFKTPDEVAQIRLGNRLCAVGYLAAEKILRGAKIRGRNLVYRGRPVTSESVRFAIESAILEQGGHAKHTIVAGGDQACDPHNTGAGPLRPHELIIIDIFPRVEKSGYFGDMTRTYLKGRPREVQRRLVATVREAQLAAIRHMRAGTDGKDVHAAVQKVFDDGGYKTTHGKNGSTGFFHGTGHGLGLAVHDPGRMAPTTYALKKGMVLTVEPGLYYPGLGGCRWEDVMLIQDGPAKFLSRHPYNWEIR